MVRRPSRFCPFLLPALETQRGAGPQVCAHPPLTGVVAQVRLLAAGTGTQAPGLHREEEPALQGWGFSGNLWAGQLPPATGTWSPQLQGACIVDALELRGCCPASSRRQEDPEPSSESVPRGVPEPCPAYTKHLEEGQRWGRA